MGCCGSQRVKDANFEKKEKMLQIHKLKTEEILKFAPEDDSSLDFPNVVKILGSLNLVYDENTKNTLLRPFFEIFVSPSIRVQEFEEYDSKILMAALTILSNGPDQTKLRQIFILFDVGGNNSLSKNEFFFMIKSLLMVVDEMTSVFSEMKYESSDMSEIIKQETIEKILKKVTNFCFSQEEKPLTCEMFVKQMIEMKSELKYDFMSVSGIMFILREWIDFKENLKIKLKQNEILRQK